MVKVKKQKMRSYLFRMVPFCNVGMNCLFSHDGVEYYRFSPRCGMTVDGQVKSFKDCDLVKLVG